MKLRRGNTLVPVVIIILAISAVVGMVAWTMWPTDKELAPSESKIHKPVNKNVTNVSTVNKNTDQSANSKTYSNTSTGLTFTYGSAKIIREYENPFEVRVMDSHDPNRNAVRQTGDVHSPGDVGITQLQTYYSDPTTYLSSTFNLRAEITPTIVAGETAARVTYSQPLGTDEDDLILYAFNHAGKTWVVRLDHTGVAGSADEEFEAMVKSISFSN